MRIFVIVAVSVFAAFIVFGAVGGYIESQGLITSPEGLARARVAAGVTAFALFLVLAFAMVPIFLRLFILGQVKIGNGEWPPIKLLREHEIKVRVAVWLFFALGMLIALPAMLHNGFFE